MTLRTFLSILVVSTALGSLAEANQCQALFTNSTIKNSIHERAAGRSEEALSDAEKTGFSGRPVTEHELRVVIEKTSEEFGKTGNVKLALLLAGQQMRLTQVQIYKVFAKIQEKTLRHFARGIYRPVLLKGREMAKEIGAIWRAYITRQSMSLAWRRWTWVEKIFEHGKDESSYGVEASKGLVTVLSKITSPSEQQIQQFRSSVRAVGRDLVLSDGRVIKIKPFELSPMINLSGMSYPQLSANSVLSLLYMHVQLAKQGVRYTYNTGEGGPSFHLALLDRNGSREELTSAVTRYAIDNGMIKPFSLRQAAIERSVERLLEDRDILFKEFSDQDIAKAQIIGQLGPALNGARTVDNRIDLSVLAKWAQKPYYAGTQFKLKQAAKKGAKVNGSKVGAVTAYLRKIMPGKSVDAPELSIEWSNVESLAEAIIAAKMVTRKPVSLKFGVGQAHEVYDMLKDLRDFDALPDQIQLDGSGYVRLPGSGNAPMMDNTSLNITTATMAVDAIMKKLGIRDRIYLESTGDIITPSEAMMNMSLGADGVAAARLWMGMGLGCALVMKCASGACYYGIANGDGKLFSEGLDPRVIGPKGAAAAKYWFESYSRLILESGADGTRPFREQMGLDNRYNTVRMRGETQLHSLRDIFPLSEVELALNGRMTIEEIERHIYGAATDKTAPVPARTEEQQAIQAVTEETLAN